MHHLLPWFLTGRLREEETVAFRAHLEACPTCRDDRAWVEKMRAEVETHGAAVLEDHPDPDALVGAVLGEGEGNGEEAARVRRHLALCPTCELEARWVAGDAVVATRPGTAARFITRHAVWGWTAAAAASIALVAVLTTTGRLRETVPGLLKPAVVVPALRALGAPQSNVFTLGPDDAGLELVLEADLPPEDFPIDVEIVDGSGRKIYERSGIGREYLANEQYLLVPCLRDRCSPGSYVARIRGTAGGERLELSFEIRGAR